MSKKVEKNSVLSLDSIGISGLINAKIWSEKIDKVYTEEVISTVGCAGFTNVHFGLNVVKFNNLYT